MLKPYRKPIKTLCLSYRSGAPAENPSPGPQSIPRASHGPWRAEQPYEFIGFGALDATKPARNIIEGDQNTGVLGRPRRVVPQGSYRVFLLA
jgi:hypothetical protein